MSIHITLPNPAFSIRRDSDVLKQSLEYEKGVYVLYDREGVVLYVGKSINIFSRIKSHLQGKDSAEDFHGDIHSITVYRVPDAYEREIYETYAINKLKPLHNKCKTYFKAYEMETVEHLAEIELEIHLLKDKRDRLELWGFEEVLNSDEGDDDYYYGYGDYHEEQQRRLGDFLYLQRKLLRVEKRIKGLQMRKNAVLQRIYN